MFHIYEDTELITSDNPVIMHKARTSELFNVFDPDNIISLPLDNKNFLTIFPNTEEALIDRIFRGGRDKWFAFTTNFQIEENSEDWILGKPNSIHKHMEDQKQYGEHSPQNLQVVQDMKEKANDMLELNRIAEASGGINEKVAEKVKELRQKRIHKNDPEMRRLLVQLKELGYLTD